MRRAIWAIYFHRLSTNSKPRHQMCNILWCKYLQSEKDPKIKFDHKSHNLPEAVMDEIKPIFKDLTHPDLLNKCLDGYTQNANESINQKIWKICPKNQYHGAQTVRTAVGLAVITFNDGMKRLSQVLKKLDIPCGSFATEWFAKADSERIKKAEVRSTEASLEYRRRKRRERLALDEATEDGAYASGSHAFE